MASEQPKPRPYDRARIARRIAGAYFLFAAAWIVVSDVALLALTRDLPDFAGGSFLKGGAFVLVTTALLYVFISGSLRRHVGNDEIAGIAGRHPLEKFAPAIVFTGLAIFAIAIVIAMFSRDSAQSRESAQQQLKAILDLKVSEVELLLEQRQAIARSYSHSRNMHQDLKRIAARADPAAMAQLQERMIEITVDLGFDAALLIDAMGRVLAAVGREDLRQASPELLTVATRSIKTGVATSHFLHKVDRIAHAPIVLDYVTPPAGEHGVLVLREDARTRLFHTIHTSPTPSATAETLLVRQEGHSVLYLSDLRHERDAAFRLRLPLSDTHLVAVKAIGYPMPQLVEGTDYRGKRVIAASRPVLGTDWLLIAKMDRDEIFAPARRSAAIWLASILCMALLAAAGVAILWRQQLRLVAANERAEAAGRQIAERRLGEAEERYRALFEQSLDCVFVADLSGHFLDANQAALDLLGYAREDIPSISFATLLDAGQLARAFSVVGEIARSGASKELHEFTLRRKDGGMVVVEVQAVLISRAGRLPAVMGIARDVTARRQAEALLRSSEERYRRMFHANPQPMWFYDLETLRFLAVNDAAVAQYGYSVDEFLAMTIADIRPPEDVPRLLENVARVREGVAEPAGTWRHRRKDGSEIDVEITSHVMDYEGRRVEVVLAVDVTGRKRQEARIARLTQLRNALSDINRTIVHASDENALFAGVCAIAVRHAGFVLAWIGVPDAESGSVYPLTSAGGRAGIEYLGRIRVSFHDEPDGRGATGAAIREKRAIIINSFLEDDRTAPWHEAARSAGIRASAAIPLMCRGTVAAVLNVYAGTPGYFDDEIRDLIEEMAGDVSFALDVLHGDRERRAALEKAQELTDVVNRSPAVFFLWRAEPGWPASAVSENVSVFGYTPEDFVSGRIAYADIVHPDDVEHLAQEVDAYTAAGIADFRQEYRLRTASGDWRWVDDRTRVVRDGSGRVARLEGLVLDITERKQAEQAVRENEQRLRAMVEQTISGFYVVQDGRLTFVNSRFAEIFGYPGAGEITGKDPLELVAERDRAKVAENFRRRLAGEVPSLSYTFTGLRRDGSEFDVGVHGSVATYGGRPAIMGLLQDISDRKRAEEEIKRYIARLEQATQSTINVVATIGELRDPYTHGHERRVGEIAAAIAQEMGLDASRVEGIRIAGYLHDVGKIGVPAELLAKPTRLTKAEYELIKDHAQQSYEILKTVDFPWPVAEAAWQHHERLDGSGYPRGLKGEDIILEARVLAVADVVEAMSSHRPYRPGLGIERALEEIEKNRDKLYCPLCVDACLRLFRDKGYTLPA